MPVHQNRGHLSSAEGNAPSTIVFVAVAFRAQPDERVGIVRRHSGQDLIDLFHEMDRPDSDEAIIGVQLAISPELNGTSGWTAEAIVDFARVKLLGADACGVDTYAYRLASDGLFMDGARIEPSNVVEWRSLYQVASAEGPNDTELVAHQVWLSTVISRIVNEMHPTEAADDYG
ncbi:hypothetical protein [Pseudomonas sp. RIT-PI-r]|uniref:hypothetical protein n=1 Tax=Pseudomonas sp. RIT-PI-r TaxID=1699620 RepID=UPI0006D6C1F6|nr:hypothetical protein [Pseudomonas sp. RIT-PI-r]KPG96324.1 hypothetical protein AK821_13475 [Pseudomonas sp. RIT-PI-r]